MYKVLFVEDDLIIVNLLAEVIELECDKLYIAYNGEMGLEVYNKVSPNLIITDLHMPTLNGIEMIRKIRKNNKEIPIFITSAISENKSFIKELEELNINYIINKPVDIDSLLDKIKEFNI